MGAITSRQNAGVEEVDVASHHAYRYPPRSGNYFGSHFIMGGERFDTPQPESYLFGENQDLNFLGSKPAPFPYPPPQPNEPTKTLKSLVNIRKESLRFVRGPADYAKPRIDRADGDVELGKACYFNIEFTFDCDVRCAITIHYLCMEELGPNGVIYIPRDPKTSSETYHYKRGANQQFCQMSHVFDPTAYSEDELIYDLWDEAIPVVIHCVTEEGPEELRQSHSTYATVEKITDGTYTLKALKQKLFVDGLCYLLQEIYGIENKNNEKQCSDDDGEDNGSECVICMCDVRDTLILPCRHLCLCNSCADSLRYQANNCPICRAPFRALLQIRALQKIGNAVLPPINPPEGNCENIPPGYEAVSLIEALNGPCIPRAPAATMPDLVETPENEPAIQAAQILNRQPSNKQSKEQDDVSNEFGMSVLLSRDENKANSTKHLSEIAINQRNKPGSKVKDAVKVVNEKTDKEEVLDDDSEAEKLSPLLKSPNVSNEVALNMDDVVESIDGHDTDTEEFENKEKCNCKEDKDRADESDYYTPEEPNATEIMYEAPPSSIESTPRKLPGTPLSHASARSSQDSYTSSSSTRHLLAIVNNSNTNERAVQI